jgi:hypothetical protein
MHRAAVLGVVWQSEIRHERREHPARRG